MLPFFELPVKIRHTIYRYTVKLDRRVRAHELHAYIRNRHWLRSSILNVHPMVRVDAFQTFILENTFDILDIQDHVMGPAFFDFVRGQKQYHPQLLLYVEKYINDNRLVRASLMQLRKATLRIEKRGGTFTFVGLELLVFIPGIQQLTLDFTRDPKYDVGLYMDCDESELMKIGEHPIPQALFSPSLRKIIVLVDGDESGPEKREELVTAWASFLGAELAAEGLRTIVETEVCTKWSWRFLSTR